jgi:hypothetical protein
MRLAWKARNYPIRPNCGGTERIWCSASFIRTWRLFRRYLATAATSLYAVDDEYHRELVAAKMMGRWRGGCPVYLSPDKDDLAIAQTPSVETTSRTKVMTKACAARSARTCSAAIRERPR